jgi:hypothetical protein
LSTVQKPALALASLPALLNRQTVDRQTVDIDGRPRFAKLSIDNVEKVEIAAIDPDFIEAEASVPDGMR